MKQFLTILFTIILVQILWSGSNLCTADTDSIAIAQVENTSSVSEDTLTSIPDEPVSQVYAFSMDKTTTSGLQSMARRLRSSSSRIQLIMRGNILHVKTLIGHLSRLQSMLTACATRSFTSLSLTHWNVPADCYVFGIRHIII